MMINLPLFINKNFNKNQYIDKCLNFLININMFSETKTLAYNKLSIFEITDNMSVTCSPIIN